MSNCTENILSYVRGNDVLVDLRFFENVMDGEQVVEQPFDLTMCDEVRAKVYDAGPIDYGISRTVSNSLVLRLPRTIPKGKYSLEIIALRGGMQVRSFDMTFHVVGTNREACSTLATSGSYTTTSFRITFRMVPQALVRGKSAYELWKELPGNEDKGLQDYIDGVLDFHRRGDEINAEEAARVAAENARVLAEQGRVRAEDEMASAERARITAEANRENAEAKRERDTAAAVAAADAATMGAERVNASLSGTVLTVTDRTGQSESVDVRVHMMLFEVDNDMQLSVTQTEGSEIPFALEDGYLTIGDNEN